MRIRVIAVRPDEPPREEWVDESIPSLREFVGGDLDFSHLLGRRYVLVCNDYGHALGLPVSRTVNDTPVPGPFLIAAVTERDGEMVSLSDDDLRFFMAAFDLSNGTDLKIHVPRRW